MIEIYLKYYNMHTFRIINTFICINNHVNSCINSMLSIYLSDFSYFFHVGVFFIYLCIGDVTKCGVFDHTV